MRTSQLRRMAAAGLAALISLGFMAGCGEQEHQEHQENKPAATQQAPAQPAADHQHAPGTPEKHDH